VRNPSKTATAARLVVKREKVAGVKFPTVTTPDGAARAALELIGDNAYEVFLVLYLNVRNEIIGYEELTEDSVAGVSVNSSSIVRNALLSGAPAILTVHNHPSGNLEPSAEDHALWARLKLELKTMGLALVDNLVVGGNGYYSEAEGQTRALHPGPQRKRGSP
jgi:DNA repair protein RadC